MQLRIVEMKAHQTEHIGGLEEEKKGISPLKELNGISGLRKGNEMSAY